MMRKVTVLSTNGEGRKEVTTDVTTWGALKPLIQEQGLTVNNMKATVRSTKNTLESNDSVLPNEDFVIFLTPMKVKSGK